MKKLLAIFVAVSFVFGATTFANAADLIEADESFAMPNDVALGIHAAVFTEQETMQVASWLVDQRLTSNRLVDPTCDSLDDENCKSSILDYVAILPVCKDASDINCLSEVGAIQNDGTKIVGTFDKYFPSKAQNEFLGNSSYQLPSGTSGALFTVPGITHKGGNSYFATFTLKGNVSRASKTSSIGSFDARITPVQLQTAPRITGSCGSGTNCPDAGWALDPIVKEWGIQASGFDGEHSCVATSAVDLLCAQRFSFPADTRFYLKARLNLAPTGWLHGRIADPKLDIDSKSGITNISIEALPVRVPTVYKAFMWNDLPNDLKSQYNESTGGFKLGQSDAFTRQSGSMSQTDPMKRNYISQPKASARFGIEELKAWLPSVGDKANAVPSMWSVRTLREDEIDGANSCFKSGSKVTGIVTTNSTQYSAGPPSFDKSEGSLVYKVAAPHYASNGDVFKGSYNLVMRSDIARCIYGFTKAPIKAELSIVSADGVPQIATTVLGEKDGWVSLSAQNFEFSAPVIKAKLTQEAEPTPTPSATPKPISKAVTITCIKGKATKKVTAVKPKCPTGYKKK